MREEIGIYLRLRWRALAFSVLAIAIFGVTFRLYHLPVAAVIYPAGVCLLLLLLWLIQDFFRTRRRHREIQRLEKLTAEMIDTLPAAESVIEADYQELLRGLCRESARLHGEKDVRYRETLEYYTAWAHQIKTPIAAMKLTLQGEDTPRARQLRANLMRIEQYVEMVMTYLRLDSVSTDYVFRTCRLDDVLRPSLRKFAPEFIDRKLTLTYEPVEAEIVTDEKWLAFVVEQLLSNALKYTRTGGITLRWESPRTLCIADTGIGIAAADLPRVFERGYTGLNGRADRSASGIGLYLCRRVCHNLGIEIRIDSTVGEGTEVRLSFAQQPGRME